MEEELAKIGLSSKAAKVYLALLELGPSAISTISKKTGLNRTGLYDVIPSLLIEGLIIRMPNTKTERYEAESPEKLPLIIESKINNLQQQLGSAKELSRRLGYLALHSKANKPKVTLFEGEDGLKKMYEDSLLCKSHIRSFLSPESVESFDYDFVHSYFRRRAEKQILIKGIINDVPEAWEYVNEEKKLGREIRVVPKEMMAIQPEVYVYDNKVAFYSLKEKYGVLIESADIAESIKKLYDLAWAEAKHWDEKLRKEKA